MCSAFSEVRLLIIVVLMLFFSVIRVSLVRDDLLQLKRTEPTNFKKLTAVFLFTVRPCRQPPDRVGVSSHTR